MKRRFWLIILVIAVLIGVLYCHFRGKVSNIPQAATRKSEIQKEEIKKEEIKKDKSLKTIELEKPPFIR